MNEVITFFFEILTMFWSLISKYWILATFLLIALIGFVVDIYVASVRRKG